MTTTRSRSWLLLPATAASVGLLLSGCVENNPSSADGGSGAIAVTSTDDSCDVATTETTSGSISFDVTNEGSQVTEFYLMADDGLQIIGEVENIAPGTSRSLTATVQPGSYKTLCKPGMIGAGVGEGTFTVTGDRVEITGDDAEQKQLAVDQYAAFVKDQVAQLLPATQTFVAAYIAGDDDAAREQFATVRTFYERIEPVAEALGDLDPRIDYREVDAVAEGLEWTGFHRIEKDLWVPPRDGTNSDGVTNAWLDWEPSTPEQRVEYGNKLVADVQELYDYVHSADFITFLDDRGIDWISNGSIGLLDEVATGKITGEEDWWSGTDLWDFAANVEGSQMAFSLVRDFAESQGDEGAALVADIDAGYADLNGRLAQFGSLDAGFVNYTELTDEDKRGLSESLNALAEPLSNLTTTILG
ncbi:iron uptake system protein EfeO [Millisia brevis]|uniref:iron uptake system protein EfeO n=1 Tax=Millisia brevis TaxID=264148 RepID=UPI00082BC84D|nr:iron uptake system protein EfeO [Millisia brevis]